MIDADYTKRQIVRSSPEIHRNSWLRKGRIDVVDGYWVVRIRCVTRDVADHGQLPVLRRQRACINEWRDLGREVDAVNKDVGFHDLLVWPGLS